MYGRIGAGHHGNPYGDPPRDYANDVAYSVMGGSWHDTTSLYGPLFTMGAEVEARVAGNETDRAAWLYRAAAALAVLGTATIAASLATRPAFAAAFVGWNPLLAMHFGGGGHNDAMMMLLVVGAVVLSVRGSPNLAGISWTAAIAIKWVAAAFLVIWAIDRIRRRHRSDSRGRGRRGRVRCDTPLRLRVADRVPGSLAPGPPHRIDRSLELAR